MKITVTENIFHQQFRAYGRGNEFSPMALSALYEFLEDVMGEDYELDVIAICCEFTEDNHADIAEQYDVDIDDYSEDEAFDKVVEYLQQNTIVVYSDKERDMIVYQEF